ncbi:MAG: MBL fold metallo-hydrolase [Chitinophagales bacterium]|nr:MBL fold metallo-hydrolase [Chitinophagales bacterium]
MNTPKIRVLDIKFLDEPHVIANYLIESADGLILIETGPETAFEHLKEAIKAEGFDWRDVKHVLLTHIHFDHAGAAWKFAENGAKIYVHPVGLPHLNSPERLWNSAKRIYKEDMERLWGEMKPIDIHLLVPLEDGDTSEIGGVKFKVHYTPGHAVHHNAYQLGDIIFTGDVAGVKINGGLVVPPCPPPDINIELWKKSIQKLKDAHPKVLYLAHFAEETDIDAHFDKLEAMLDDWSGWMKPYFDAGTPAEEIVPKFVAYTANQLRENGVSDADIEKYEKGNPSYMSVTGLLRYWKLKEEGRI